VIDAVSDPGPCGRAAHPLRPDDVASALRNAEDLQIRIEATPWVTVHRAWALSLGRRS
jgi:hypothetical protein